MHPFPPFLILYRAGAREGFCIISVNDVNVSQLPHKDVVDLIRKSQSVVNMVIMAQPPPDSELSQSIRRLSQAEEEALQVSQDRVRLEQTAVDMETDKLTQKQHALRAEQQRVEAERGKLQAEQDRLRQEQDRLRQERRQVDRTQGLAEKARAAAAAAAADKLAAEEQVRKLLEEERMLKEYHMEVERLRREITAGNDRLVQKQKRTDGLMAELKKIATAKEIEDVQTMVGLVETKAQEDLRVRQGGELPLDEREKIIEEKRREMERVSLLEQVEDIRLLELSKLQNMASERRRMEEQKREEDREKLRQAHFKDMQTLREKQQRLQQIMEEAMEQKRRQDEEEAARRKAEVEARRQEAQARLAKVNIHI